MEVPCDIFSEDRGQKCGENAKWGKEIETPLAVAEHDEQYELWRKQCNVMVEPHLVHLGAQRQLQYIIDTEVSRSVCLFCNRPTFQFRPNQNIKHQFTDFTGHAPCCYLLRKSKVPSKKPCHLSVVPQRHELSRPLPAWWMEAKRVQGPSNMNGNRKHRVIGCRVSWTLPVAKTTLPETIW